MKATSHTITASINVPSTGNLQGVIVAAGGSGGYSFFVKDGYLMYENNFFGRERDIIKSTEKIPAGKNTVSFEYTHEAKTFGGGGTGKLFINGKEVGKSTFAHVPTVRYSATETFDIGEDTGEPASTQYNNNFPFTGEIVNVKIVLKPAVQNSTVQAQSQEHSKKAANSIE